MIISILELTDQTSAYVDDLGPSSNSEKGMVRVKRELNVNFPVTDLGEMEEILGIRVEKD